MAVVIGTNAGFVETAPSSDPTGSDTTADESARASRDTSPATAVRITEMGVYISNATEAAQIELGFYDHDAVYDLPKDLIEKTEIAKGTTEGWKIDVGLNWTISSSTIYWVATQCDNTATTTELDYGINVGYRQAYRTIAGLTALPNPWIDTLEGNNLSYAVYAVWEAGEPPPGINTKINIGDAWKEISAMKINIGDTWKAVSAAKINIGDTWKTIF